MQNTLKKILKILARAILRRYRPEVIGITGSVGKTSAKEAIACVLGAKYRVRSTKKSYNNELGLPLTIIDAEAQGGFIPGWLFVFLKALWLILVKDPSFPEIIILEMGIDHPGDMDYLLEIVAPQSGVVTAIGQSHMEFFGSQDKIEKEKARLIQRLSGQGWAILNYDDLRVRRMAKLSKSKILTYGLEAKAVLRAIEPVFSFERKQSAADLHGLSFKIKYDGSAVPVHLPGVIGYPVIYAALAAAALGVTHQMNLIEISQALYNFQPPRGRLNLIKGIKQTMIIDDTYNASPQSTLEALRVSGMINLSKKASRWAVLGDMLELGSFTEEGHLSVGQAVVLNRFDYLVAVGERAHKIIEGALNAGLSKDQVYHFSTSAEAGLFVQDKLGLGDLVLVKGSQGMRMERVVKELMTEPMRAKELLVRQDWPDV